MPSKQIIFFLVFTFLVSRQSVGDEVKDVRRFVYTVHVGGCLNSRSALLTGFRVKGQPGIVTALHGVVGCRTYTAEPEPGEGAPFVNLRIKSVDVDEDVALLTSAELQKNFDGLSVVVHWSPENLGPLAMYGHRLGIALQRTSLVARKPPIVRLIDRIPPGVITAMHERNSPNTRSDVLDLEGGTVLPGDSGAPILDQTQRVIAVADGGLESGHDQISWAIPYLDIRWQPVGNAIDEISRLTKLSSHQLFSFNPDPNDSSADAASDSSTHAPHTETVPLGNFGSLIMFDSSTWVPTEESESLLKLSHNSLTAMFILEDDQMTTEDLKARLLKRIGGSVSTEIQDARIELIQGKQFMTFRTHAKGLTYTVYFYSGRAGTLQAVVFGPDAQMSSAQPVIEQLMEGIMLKSRF